MKNTEILKIINHIDTLMIDKKVWEEHLIRTQNFYTNRSAKTRSKKQKELIQELKDSEETKILEKIWEIEREIEKIKEKNKDHIITGEFLK